MPRLGSTPFAFPDFRGATRRLVVVNLAAFFMLALAGLVLPGWAGQAAGWLTFQPAFFLHGAIWQPLTYSLIHPSLIGTLFELLSLWFLAGFLESAHGDAWITGLYVWSVLGTALAGALLYLAGVGLNLPVLPVPLYGCFGGIFGLLVAIGLLYGDTQFLLFFTIGIKARYMAIIFGLVAIAMLFGEQRLYAFAQLGGALAGYIYIRMAPRRGFRFAFSESWYGLRNRYYRWKRRRAARKFEVYMRAQGRTVRFDGKGQKIDDDHDDKSRWN
ncbi:MAG: rhomboid family intramembrane serine protease [Acidobacteriota bacterium]|nr:rhomboid family intramembrane serine protease [Acidobacteriota bacterium]